MKTKFILHGGYSMDENLKNKEFFSICFEDAPENPRVLVILFASDDREKDIYQDLCNKLRVSTNKNPVFVRATREDFMNQAENADIVYFEGGETDRLVDAMREYSNLEEGLRGKIIVGSSAGAYLFSVICASHSDIPAKKGLGILPIKIVCHDESLKLPPSKMSLDEIRNTQKEIETIFLKDYEYKVFYKDI